MLRTKWFFGVLIMNDWAFDSFLKRHIVECDRVVSTKLNFARHTTTENKINLRKTRKELVELNGVLNEVYAWNKIACANVVNTLIM